MTDKNKNKLSMYAIVLTVLINFRRIWSGVPALMNAVDSLTATIQAIKAFSAQQELPLTGISKDKKALKTKLAEIASQVCGALYSFGLNTHNNELRNMADKSRTGILQMRDELIVTYCQGIKDKAQELLITPVAGVVSILDYGISQPVLDMFQAAIGVYTNKTPTVRNAKTQKISIRQTLNSLFVQGDGILDSLDHLMIQYKLTETSFYNQYVSARSIIDMGKRTFKQKTFTVSPGAEGITILKVMDQGKATNVGTTVLAWRSNPSDEPRLIEPGASVILNAPKGNILVTNQHVKKTGKISVEVHK